ncbi:MAG: DNA-processing protein DprA [Pseudomonadota bacterium]
MPDLPAPTSPAEIPLDAILLAAIDGLGPTSLRSLRAHFGPRPAGDLDASDLAQVGLNPDVQGCVQELLEDREQLAAWGERIRRGLEPGGHLLPPEEVDRLPGLLDLPDPPVFLAASPRLLPTSLGASRVAIVGTREASREALQWTHDLARDLARHDILVVSGGARGIDTAAHRGAREGGGETLCVLGGSFDAEHEARPDHLRWLWSSAMVLSEVYWAAPLLNWMYPRRNRLVAALSQVVVVVQGRARSGARITADWARRLGRTILAVPGDLRDARAATPNDLLAGGALVCRHVDDVMQALDAQCGGDGGSASRAPVTQLELGARPRPKRTRRSRPASTNTPVQGPAPGGSSAPVDEELSSAARAMVEVLASAPAGVELDALGRRLGLSAGELASSVLELELAGRVQREPGPRLVLVRR